MQHRDKMLLSFFVDIPSMADEFPVLLLYFNGVKMFGDFFYSIRVTHCNDGAADFIGFKVQVIDSATGVDDKFGFSYTTHTFSV